MRENAHLYIRHDAHRFMRPDAPGWSHPDEKLRNLYFRFATRKALGLPPLTEADAGWQIILKSFARYQEACRKAGFNPFAKPPAVLGRLKAVERILDRTSLFQNDKPLISLSFVEGEGSLTGYDPG